MPIKHKQLKINKLFRKGPTYQSDDIDELQEEIQQLEQQLKNKQNELFELQRDSYRCQISPVKKTEEPFVPAQKIVLTNSVNSLKKKMDLMSMLTGMEVQSYVANNHCSIVFHMQHDSEHVVKHGLKIDMRKGKNVMSKSLPLGFNLSAVLEDYDNVMMPDCLGAIRKALMTYYDRLDQFDKLQKLLNIDARLFKILDASHIEISFSVRNKLEAEDTDGIEIVLVLHYRVYDIRPKQYSFKDMDVPEYVENALRQQCFVFKKKPLHKAFREAFVTGVGTYKMVTELGPTTSPRLRHRPHHPNKQYDNDDTFRPEECSETDDEEP